MRQIVILATLIIAAPFLARGQANAPYAHGRSIATYRCAGGQLSLTRESEDAGAGQRAVIYSFSNNATLPCTLRGFPRYVLLNRRGRRMSGQQVRHNTDPVTTVTLAPGGKAFFHINYSACSVVGDPPCRFSYKVRIKPPRSWRSFIRRERIDPFHLSLTISPVKDSAP